MISVHAAPHSRGSVYSQEGGFKDETTAEQKHESAARFQGRAAEKNWQCSWVLGFLPLLLVWLRACDRTNGDSGGLDHVAARPLRLRTDA